MEGYLSPPPIRRKKASLLIYCDSAHIISSYSLTLLYTLNTNGMLYKVTFNETIVTARVPTCQSNTTFVYGLLFTTPTRAAIIVMLINFTGVGCTGDVTPKYLLI